MKSFSSRKELARAVLELNVPLHPQASGTLIDLCIASADRRPVDPPPVVELRIYEGEERNDVTFSYNANFFLFTTLEHARPMAQGRVPVTQHIAPVLTGMPVAGMAYLDRPKAAGYFIFPDLSVRHEGKYRLSFNLYEELKESKDVDVALPEGSLKPRDKLLQSSSMAPKAHVHYRLEVKSEAFDVFSAKKFPGLAESTTLSRLVAEQGCRVRIRRDVRMRRRDKGIDKYQEMDDESHFARSDGFATPQQALERPRSISHGSLDAHTPYSSHARPLSASEVGYFPPAFQQVPNPPPIQSASSYHSHLSFGGAQTPQYQTPTVAAATPLASARQAYVQSNNGFQYTSPVHTRQMSAPQNYGFSPVLQAQNSGSYVQPGGYMSDSQTATDYRRASSELSMSRPQLLASTYYPTQQPVQHHNLQYQTPSRSLTPINTSLQNGPPPSLPSVTSLIRQTPLEPKAEPVATEISAMPQGPQNPFSSTYASANYSQYFPSPPQASTQHSNGTPQSLNYYVSNHPYSTQQASATQSKRPYGAVFDSSHLNQPMHSGMRPNSAHQGKDFVQIETDEGFLDDDGIDYEAEVMKPLVYKRADGTRQAKKCPSPRVRSVLPVP